MIPGPHSRLARLTAVCLTLLPAVFLAVLIVQYSVDFPQWDEWGYVKFFQKLSQHTLTFSDLFAQANEYRQFFPNLTFVVLGRLTRWDLRYEMWVILAVACLISFNCYLLARLTIDGPILRRLLLLFLANLLIFTPVQFENWLQGQQLVYFVPIACVTICILVAHSRLRLNTRFLICGCLSTISTFSSANGVVCWIVVLPVLLTASSDRIHHKGWLLGGWIAALLTNAAFYMQGYHRPWWSPSPLTALARPVPALHYFLNFLGAPLGLERGRLALVAGILLLAMFAAACVLVIRFRGDFQFVRRTTPWLMIGAYSILTAAMTMIGRIGLGVGQSLNSRYIGYSVYLVVSLVFLAPLVSEKLIKGATFRNSRRPAQLAVAAAVALLLWQPFMLAKGVARMKEMRQKLLQAKASVLLINYVRDPLLVTTMYPDLNFLAAQANILDELGYLRPGLIRSNRLQDFEGGQESGQASGSMDRIEAHDNLYIVSGTATLPNRREVADAVILTYEQPNGDSILFALTHPKVRTGGLYDSANDVEHLQHWQLSFSLDRLPSRPTKVTAWAFDANRARAYRLEGASVIP